MMTQINTIPTTCTNSCKTNTSRNIMEVDGVQYVLVGDDSTKTEVVLEFLPLQMWVTDEWNEGDVVRVAVEKPIQDGFVGESEWELYPKDDGYDHCKAEREIIQDASYHLSSRLEEMEVRHAS